MLFRAEDLNTGLLEANNILSEAAYIGSPIMALNTVSVVEDTTLGKGVVRFADVEALSEETGADYLDIISALSESNGLHPEDLVVAVDEADIILDPSIVTELANVVVNPISENSLAYRFCEACVDAWLDTGNEGYLETIIDEGASAADAVYDNGILADDDDHATKAAAIAGGKAPTVRLGRTKEEAAAKSARSRQRQEEKATPTFDLHKKARNAIDTFGYNHGLGQNLSKKAAIGAGIVGAGIAAYKNRDRIAGAAKGLLGRFGKGSPVDANKVMKEADKKGPYWVSRKIASLRNMYAQWLQKAKAESDQGKANIFKQIASKIMSVIDALMKKLQSMTA